MIKVLCSPGSRGLWLAQGALTSPASWAVAVGRGGCVALWGRSTVSGWAVGREPTSIGQPYGAHLARGSCSAPSPGSAARPGSATPTRTSGGFWAPAWRCLWAASRACGHGGCSARGTVPLPPSLRPRHGAPLPHPTLIQCPPPFPLRPRPSVPTPPLRPWPGCPPPPRSPSGPDPVPPPIRPRGALPPPPSRGLGSPSPLPHPGRAIRADESPLRFLLPEARHYRDPPPHKQPLPAQTPPLPLFPRPHQTTVTGPPPPLLTGTRTPHRRTCRSSRSACAPCRPRSAPFPAAPAAPLSSAPGGRWFPPAPQRCFQTPPPRALIGPRREGGPSDSGGDWLTAERTRPFRPPLRVGRRPPVARRGRRFARHVTGAR